MSNSQFTFIDLFCGCGGFSLGLAKAGLIELAAIDFNHQAIEVYRANFPNVKFALEEDLREYNPSLLAKVLNKDHVDIIVGGPPCQGFSNIRQVDGANSGKRLVHDDRRNLYKEFLKYVEYFKPSIFIMENVPGIRSAVGGYFFTKVQTEARKLGYRVCGEIIRAWEFGVPQKRVRQLIIGTKLELPLFSSKLYGSPTHGHGINNNSIITLWEAIGDLPLIKAGGGAEKIKYDYARRKNHLRKYGGRYLNNVLEVEKTRHLTSHHARQHNERDLRDFQRLKEGENSALAIKLGQRMEFPYDRENFKIDIPDKIEIN